MWERMGEWTYWKRWRKRQPESLKQKKMFLSNIPPRWPLFFVYVDSSRLWYIFTSRLSFNLFKKLPVCSTQFLNCVSFSSVTVMNIFHVDANMASLWHLPNTSCQALCLVLAPCHTHPMMPVWLSSEGRKLRPREGTSSADSASYVCGRSRMKGQ